MGRAIEFTMISRLESG